MYEFEHSEVFPFENQGLFKSRKLNASGYDAPPFKGTMAGIHITDIESAINYWRAREPSPDGVSLPAPTRALAEVYALLIYYHEVEADPKSMPPKALDAWMHWYQSTPDTPCIAICSTSQGDEICKGCGRTFEEVQYWPEIDRKSVV